MAESRRTTPKGTRHEPDELPTLRQRSPVTFWVLMLLAASLVAGPALGIIALLVG